MIAIQARTSTTEERGLLACSLGAAEPHVFCIEWNVENQLTRVTKNSVEQARFKYDPMRRRVEKVSGGVTTTWTHEGSRILRQISGASTLKYAHGPGIDEPLAVDDGTSLSSSFHADALGSVVKTTSAAGAVTLARQYDAWGTLQAGATTAGYAFTGREWDPEIGLHYYRARFYDAVAGRFVREDPAGFEDGPNKYAYVRNMPVALIDPSGRVSTSEYCTRPANYYACSQSALCAGLATFLTRGFRDDGPGNAFKHCLWACCTVRIVGAQTAYEITTSHEYDSNRPCSSNMDMSNNAAGIAFGLANTGNCFDLCSPKNLKCSPDESPCKRGNY
jgi:RHS repeat-associated protein